MAILSAGLLLEAGLARAADEEAVLVFNLPPAPQAKGESSLCNESLDLSRMLADNKLRAALIGRDPAAVQVLGSITAIENQVHRFGGDGASPLIRHAVGNVSQCQSGCLVLPKGAWVKEIRSSDRKGGKGLVESLPAFDPSFGDPRTPEGDRLRSSWVVSTIGSPDLSGYRDHQLSRDNRTFCTTAANWSRAAPATQVVRVIFERQSGPR